MRLAVLTASLIGLVGGTSVAGNNLAAAEPGGSGKRRRFGSTIQASGNLAIREGAGTPWKVVRLGDKLPADAFFRTSAAGPCRIQVGNGMLQFAPETQALVVTTQRQILVTVGRVFVQRLPDWSIRTGTLRGNLSADAAAEFETGSTWHDSGSVLAGTVKITNLRLEAATVKAGHRFVAEGGGAVVKMTDLAPAETERLRALAGPPRKPQGLGQLVVNDPQSNSPVRLNLARYHVNVVLHPPVALVQIDQSFYNPYPAQQEGTFVFNLPDGASVSRFAMYTTPSQLVEGELIERERASNIYQSIVNRKRDPAILEQIGGSLFRMRVFPIFGHETKRILLDYTVPIVEQDEGRYSFELPLMSDLEPVWDFSIAGTIRGPNMAGTAHSPSHPAVVFDAADEKGAIRFVFREKSYRPEEAFVVGFQQRPAAEATILQFRPHGKGKAGSIVTDVRSGRQGRRRSPVRIPGDDQPRGVRAGRSGATCKCLPGGPPDSGRHVGGNDSPGAVARVGTDDCQRLATRRPAPPGLRRYRFSHVDERVGCAWINGGRAGAGTARPRILSGRNRVSHQLLERRQIVAGDRERPTADDHLRG